MIVGGILVARSMVGTTEVTKMSARLSQFDAAVDNFQTKYHGLPGDSPAFNNGVGNNNGLIEDANAATTPGIGAEFSGEVANFWSDLSQSGGFATSSADIDSLPDIEFAEPKQIDTMEPAAGGVSFTPTLSGPIMIGGVTANVPQSPLGGKNIGIIATNDNQDTTDVTGARARGLNGIYIIADLTNVTSTNPSIAPDNLKPAFTTEETLALDKKMDDGNPDTGDVLGNETAAGDCINTTSHTYDVSKQGANCYLFVAMQRSHKEGVTVATAGDNSSNDPGCDAQCQCTTQGVNYYWNGSCQFDGFGCNGDVSCQQTACLNAGGGNYWDAGTNGCFNDPTGCQNDQMCILNYDINACTSQGYGYMWDGVCEHDVTGCNFDPGCQYAYNCTQNGYGYYVDNMNSCQYDSTGCAGDSSCQSMYLFNACTAQGYGYYINGGNCVYDSTGCSGDWSCQQGYACTNQGTGYSWNGSSCNYDGSSACTNQGYGYWWDGSNCQYDGSGCGGDYNCQQSQSCTNQGSGYTWDGSNCNYNSGGTDCSGYGYGYYWDGMQCTYDSTGCNGDSGCQSSYYASSCTSQGYGYYWNGSCQYDSYGCGGDYTCQQNAYCSSMGQSWNGSYCYSYDPASACTGQGMYYYWDGSNCQYDGSGCNGDYNCQQTAYCTSIGETWNGSYCYAYDPSYACTSQGSGYYWDGSNCQYDGSGCNGDWSCQQSISCSSQGSYYSWDGMNCNYSSAAACTGQGMNYYWDGSYCQYDSTGCGGDQNCINSYASAMCTGQGYGYYYSNGSCNYDSYNCSGDYTCQQIASCNAQGAPYYYYDGMSCQYDYTGCQGDQACQCSATSGSWNGMSCDY